MFYGDLIDSVCALSKKYVNLSTDIFVFNYINN